MRVIVTDLRTNVRTSKPIEDAIEDSSEIKTSIEKYLFHLVAAVFLVSVAAVSGLDGFWLAIVGSASFLATHLGAAASVAGISAVRRLRAGSRARRDMEAKLCALDPIEKVVLLEFAWRGQQTIFLPYLEPPVAGLLQKGVLAPADKYIQEIMRGIRLSPLAEQLIDPRAHLGLERGALDDDGAQFIYGQRHKVHFLSDGIDTTKTGWPYKASA